MNRKFKNWIPAFVGMTMLCICPALAKERPVPTGIYLDTLTESKLEQVIQLNPIDLGGESKWDSAPIMKRKKGDAVWLWTTEGAMKAVVDRIVITNREGDFGFLVRGTINVVIKASKPIPSGRVLVSLSSLPSQNWTAREATPEEITVATGDVQTTEGETFRLNITSSSARVIDCKSHLQFLVFRYPVPSELNQDRFHTVVYMKDAKGTWTATKKFDDGMFEPWVDVDGDGIPELVGESGYESFGLKMFYPYSRVVQQSTSGI